jgi:hypothetical protein
LLNIDAKINICASIFRPVQNHRYRIYYNNMENYEIKNIDIRDKDSRIAITSLINEVFNANIGIDKIFLNTNTRNQKTVYLGAYLNNELAAVIFFIAHELMYNNKLVIAYQNCWGATGKNHRKKGLFSMLTNHAKQHLDGAFIFGFPNNTSGPILNKLGFRTIELCKLNIPVKFFPRLFLNYYFKQVKPTYQLPLKDSFIPIEPELIELKTNEYGDEIKVYANYNNIIWGRVVKRKSILGKLTFFRIGGIQVNKPHLLYLLFNEIIKKEKPHFIQLISSKNNSILNLFRGVKEAPQTEPLIICDLNTNTMQSHFNFIAGIKDVF